MYRQARKPMFMWSATRKRSADPSRGKAVLCIPGERIRCACQADKTGIAEDAVSVVIPEATLYIPFAELVDIAKEIERLEKEEKRLDGRACQSKWHAAATSSFMSKAPDRQDRMKSAAKLEKYTQMMEQVKERLDQLCK